MKLFKLFVLLCIIAVISCSDRNPTNPYDPETGTEFPAPVINSVNVVDIAKLQVDFSSNYEYYTKFQIQRSLEQYSGFSIVAEIPGGIWTYNDSLVNADSVYYYRVKGFADELQGPYSNTMWGSVSISVPANLTATALNDNQIRLDWELVNRQIGNNKDASRESGNRFDFGFTIERNEDNGSYVEIGRVSSDVLQFVDDSLFCNISYSYKIRTYLNQSYSPYTPEVTISTIPLQMPSDLSAEALTDQTISLTWIDNCPFEEGYKIERKEDEGEFIEIAQVEENVSSFIDEGLIFGNSYTYRVRAFTAFNLSEYSNEIITGTIFQSPANLTATPLNDQQIELQWDYSLLKGDGYYWIPVSTLKQKSTETHFEKRKWNSTITDSRFEEGFSIERKVGIGDFIEIGTTSAGITQFVDIDLSYGTVYTYRVRAFTSLNNSGYSNEVASSTFFPAPSDLALTPINDQSIELTWNDNCTFEDGFRIERMESGGSFIEIAELGSNVTNFTDDGLFFGPLYTYRVKAFTSLNESYYSNEAGSLTIFPTPTNLTATPLNDQSISLSWSDNCLFEEGYSVERKDNSGEFVEIAALGSNVTTFVDEELLYGYIYTYRVRASTSLNFSAYSNEEITGTIFPAPDNLITEVISFESISLNWNDNCTFEEGYKLERKENEGEFFEIAVLGANVTYYIDEDLIYSTIYTYRVRAFTTLNESGYSNEATSTLIMPAPTNLASQALNDQSVSLTWIDNCTYEEGYKVERKENGGNFIEIVSLGADVTSYIDEGLIFGTSYTYRIRAFVYQYYSDYSNESIVQTVFPAPTNLNAILLSDSEIQIDWDDNCSFETGYAIERRDSGSSFVQIAQVSTNITSYIDSGLTYGLNYIYRVRAFTDLNFSDYSNEYGALVEIAAPTNLTATANVNQILLEWDDNSTIEEGYEIERKIYGENFQVIATVGQNVITYTDTDVVNMVTYYYRVRGFTQNNYSEYSNIANATCVGE